MRLIREIEFNAGAVTGEKSLCLSVSPLTIIVGPNNSGKSRTLKEIEDWLRSSNPSPRRLIKTIVLNSWDAGTFERELEKVSVDPIGNERIYGADNVIISRLDLQGNGSNRVQVDRTQLLLQAKAPNGNRNAYVAFTSLFTLRLDGSNRLTLTRPASVTDLQESPRNYIQFLFKDDATRAKLSDIIYAAFGRYLVIDPTGMNQLRFRLSSRRPVDVSEERNWDERSVRFHGDADLIADASDGVKAFVGILSTIIAGDPWVALLDEPEAFLHPALRMRLGEEITKELKGSEKEVFVATHSADFLMGCIQAGADVNIVRLTYAEGQATARLLSREQLFPLMRNPLLRSVGVLNGLFYNAVIVTEGDSDRAFYQEINSRLLAVNDERGISGCLFLNAQNKQTVWDIVRPLRKLGIPAAGIVDLDVVKEGKTPWQKVLDGGCIPEANHPGLEAERATIERTFVAACVDMKKSGINGLPADDKEACVNMMGRLSEYGVFVVDCGELENWLAYLDVDSRKSEWLIKIFERMGEDPGDADYVAPSEDDVWRFMGRIAKWVNGKDRKGIPSC